MNEQNIYILGGHQTDFSRNWAREDKGIYDLFESCLQQGLIDSKLDAEDVDVAHVGNFVSDLFTGQAQLNGFFAHAAPEFGDIPTSRHEAACASGSMALLSAMRDLESGHYQVACVMGIELMRNVNSALGAEYLGSAAWVGKETEGCRYVWPKMFADLLEHYQQKYGLDTRHLSKIAELNFANAKRNPNSQTRNWQFYAQSFTDDNEFNPIVEGRLRKQDCGQITDGAAVVFLANQKYAAEYAAKNNISLSSIPRIKGWGHRSAPLLMNRKLELSEHNGLIFPHVKRTFDDALLRAGLESVHSLDLLEVHDCFSMTEYMLIDHLGLTAPGESWKAIENNIINFDGDLPINPSGGLIGLGHPVGATGVRMMLDAYKQTTNQCADYQIENANNVGIFNLGGSATTCASFIVGTDNH
ncbi:acetyl-CoA acetyltransferase [Aliiglaciecola sp. 2_MG-2023]|uniref:acetyl-CoA acetyltransferase n=1 Tax=unclassified Aliiglaciecola TaxID=2593648 RepID=UPI0026E41617|nr:MULTISPECIES: acetyl-CoA acetyltransferase [unclassified Aliiglaciecola]MDO6711590.1 acetyl-CoA acetyltransferase [Aliiglaciecola sp. 2_MG-2023]MDO6752661.1 acetyl-CoA acetyltransferase [Aliiglaciecola sp. 1_MG-2023]